MPKKKPPKLCREDVDFTVLTHPQKIIMNMFLNEFSYTEIIMFLGRAGIKYNDRFITEPAAAKSIIDNITRKKESL